MAQQAAHPGDSTDTNAALGPGGAAGNIFASTINGQHPGAIQAQPPGAAAPHTVAPSSNSTTLGELVNNDVAGEQAFGAGDYSISSLSTTDYRLATGPGDLSPVSTDLGAEAHIYLTPMNEDFDNSQLFKMVKVADGTFRIGVNDRACLDSSGTTFSLKDCEEANISVSTGAGPLIIGTPGPAAKCITAAGTYPTYTVSATPCQMGQGSPNMGQLFKASPLTWDSCGRGFETSGTQCLQKCYPRKDLPSKPEEWSIPYEGQASFCISKRPCPPNTVDGPFTCLRGAAAPTGATSCPEGYTYYGIAVACAAICTAGFTDAGIGGCGKNTYTRTVKSASH